MGRVTIEATVENLRDLWEVEAERLPAAQVRQVVIPDALVDTGAKMLSLPTSLIRQLGLKPTGRRRVITSSGPGEMAVYEVVRLTILGRVCSVAVLEVPDGVPALIGQLPLEELDFVVDPQNRRLIGNPAHGGEHVVEMF